MSRTRRENEISNPSKRRITWSSSDQKFVYWDSEKEENIALDKLSFMILDTKNCITGYSEKDKKGIWSNEVTNLKKEPMQIRVGNDVVAEGMYHDIKNNVQGAKYTVSLYVLVVVKGGNNYIANIKLSGSGFAGWMEFKDDYSRQELYDMMIQFDGPSEEKKKGATTYYEPLFKSIAKDKVPQEILDEADEADEKVQQYFDAVKERNSNEIMDDEDQTRKKELENSIRLQGSSEVVYEEEPDIEDDDLPF